MGRGRLLVKSALDLQEVGEQVERWRRSRTTRTRMPEELWRLVVPMAREHGIYGVAKKLRLNSEALRKRVMAAGSKSRSMGPVGAKFVELGPMLPAAVVPAGCGAVMELVGTSGNRLIVRVPGAGGTDMVALVRELWNCGS